MCGPAIIPWVLGTIGLGMVMKNQSDKAQQGMNNSIKEANKQMATIAAPKETPAPAAIAANEPLKDVAAQTDSARQDAKRKASALAGMGNTLKTSGLGVPGPAPTNQKTLLGQ